ncbi:MAG: ABC transporter substrate-binding protein, partial [Betaproteobacteria bacterium]|nr:ABC transporter substrate-binding protein [Betaproteobacteria bacterium]
AISPAYAKTLPSHPDNSVKQIPIDLAWYTKFEGRASELYQNMLTE